MFLSVEWAKRWLPAILLLLSLFLPWWMSVRMDSTNGKLESVNSYMSFPWGDQVIIWIEFSVERWRAPTFISDGEVYGSYLARFSLIPYMCLASALIMVGGLCGLSSKIRTRTLGGLLGIVGVASYFVFVFRKGFYTSELPIFKIASYDSSGYIAFISVGFFLALAGSLMLLSPLFRTLIEKLKKRMHATVG